MVVALGYGRVGYGRAPYGGYRPLVLPVVGEGVASLVSDDRGRLIGLVANGEGASLPRFRHWYAFPPEWG